MNDVNKYLSDPAFRKAVYSLAVALVPILVMLGVVTDDEATQWLAMGTAVASAMVHLLAATNTKPPSEK